MSHLLVLRGVRWDYIVYFVFTVSEKQYKRLIKSSFICLVRFQFSSSIYQQNFPIHRYIQSIWIRHYIRVVKNLFHFYKKVCVNVLLHCSACLDFLSTVVLAVPEMIRDYTDYSRPLLNDRNWNWIKVLTELRLLGNVTVKAVAYVTVAFLSGRKFRKIGFIEIVGDRAYVMEARTGRELNASVFNIARAFMNCQTNLTCQLPPRWMNANLIKPIYEFNITIYKRI